MLDGEIFQHFEGRACATGTSVRSAQNESSGWMFWAEVQYLLGLLDGKIGILLEQALRVRERHLNRPKRL